MTLVLHDAEDRRLIRDRLDATIVVEAAAGTGKTTELVERIINVVATGCGQIEQIVAVTFTEKAAGELKLRIRKELEARRQSAKGDEARRNLSAAIQHLEEAHVSTIHGFCADLLRERPVEAGIDPRFAVLSEARADELFNAAFRRWLDERLEDPPDGVRRALRRSVWRRDGKDDADGPVERIERAGQVLTEWRDFTGPWRRDPFDRDTALEAVLWRLHAFAELSSAPSSRKDLLYQDTKFIRDLDRDLQTAARLGAADMDGTEARLIDLATDSRCRRVRRGRDAAYSASVTRAAVWDGLETLIADLEAFQRAADCDLSARLHEELQDVVADYARLKQRAGALDYVDLLLRARDLLVGHAEVRRAFQTRFTHLFVDEFQDTDPLQAEILLLLASDDPAERDWTRVRPAPGKLFIVGDPKQAIYRFRRADIEIYQQVCEQLVNAGALRAYLHTSFRSTPNIQRVVNCAFAGVMNGDRETLQAQYRALAPSRPDADQPSVVVLPVPEPYGTRRIAAYAIEQSLPHAVGAFVRWLINESGWTVTERTTKDELPIPVQVQARHVCILFRRFLQFGDDMTRPYVEALEARGIRHLLVGGKSFHGREEVESIRTALAAIEWPDDELSVFATLKGALFALDDETLFEYRHRCGRFHPFKTPKDVPPHLVAVVDALSVLRRLHQRRNYTPIAETVTQLLEATRAHVGFILRPAGEQALANVLHVAELARQFEANGGISFRGFVEELNHQSEAGQAAEAPIVEEGSDGVRLMTVHKAKGLEFPVVILADMTAKLQSQRADRLIDRDRGACYLRLGRWAPIELLEGEAREAARDAAEGVRIAYVAATRARDLLVVPGVGDVPYDGGWTSPLNAAIYPEPSMRRSVSPVAGCPEFRKDSVWRRPDDDPFTPMTVCPGVHHRISPDGEPFQVVWWDPHALDLTVDQAPAVRRETLIMKDVPDAVVAQGLREYEQWRTRCGDALAAGSRPSVNVRTATEYAREPLAFAGLDRSAAARAPLQRGLFDEEAAPAADAPSADDEAAAVQVMDARLAGEGAGARFGELVHALLAAVPLDANPETVAAIAAVQGRILSATATEVAAAAARVVGLLRHDILDRARQSDQRGECRRETPMTLTLPDGTLIEGVVDLAFQESDAWTVVDYKTDREIAAAGEQHYRRQVALYAAAVQRATGKPANAVLVRV